MTMTLHDVPTYFLGTNSPMGFVSCFDQLYDTQHHPKLYIIKGGPGTGKSTFMKKVAHTFLEEGRPVHIITCSSDPHSLDAVILPDLGVCIVDGTAPHVLEPEYPGIHQSIINFGAFLQEEQLSKQKDAILKINRDLKECYARSYHNLKLCAVLKQGNDSLVLPSLQTKRLEGLAQRIIKQEMPPKYTKGQSIPRYLTAIGPEGVVTHTRWLEQQGYQVYLLADHYGIATHLLEPLAQAAVERGYVVHPCADPFCPGGKLLQVVIPELKLAFVSVEEKSDYTGPTKRTINLDRYLGQHPLAGKRGLYRLQKKLIADFTQEAIFALQDAKHCHDLLERCYMPCTDFAASDLFQATFLRRLLQKPPRFS